MSAWHPLAKGMNLHVSGHISEEDARRQTATAREMLRRLEDQPGLVLADEVGMGKTFVALAVAVSVALSDKRRRPVVVMVPSSLKEKWPQDFALFKERCLAPEAVSRVRAESAGTAVELLKLLDDPVERRASLIFLTHGAMHRGLSDSWVKLAIIQRAIRGRRNIGNLRRALGRCLGRLLWLGWLEKRCGEDIWERLLDTPASEWLSLLNRRGLAEDMTNDPVPAHVIEVLRDFDTRDVFAALQGIPFRDSATYERRLSDARAALSETMKTIWQQCVSGLRLKLPLLIMDEAHHLKNAGTNLAGLFQDEDAKGDADEMKRGALHSVFERMIFLTATPFQLGHHELCSVLERFDGIAWKSAAAPTMSRDNYKAALDELRHRLDAAQQSALNLDAGWGGLRADDLMANGVRFEDASAWWDAVLKAGMLTPSGERVLTCYRSTFTRMREAETALRPWVLRHLRSRFFNGVPRRLTLPGIAIQTDLVEPGDEPGLEIEGTALLPFLLAARATLCAPDARPVFAEGLASSYEAFLQTRQKNGQLTEDDEAAEAAPPDQAGRWYLQQLEKALPLDAHESSASHPKIAATAKRALAAWKSGEKVLVFCHYVVTGRVLRQVISGLIQREIQQMGATKLGCELHEVGKRLDLLGKRFFDADSPVRLACDEHIGRLLSDYPGLEEHREALLDVTRRYLRTPSFLVRYFPLHGGHLDAASVALAFEQGDGSGMTLRDVLHGFFEVLDVRCGAHKRASYLLAIGAAKTGTITSDEVFGTITEDEAQRDHHERLLPNVRLVNGATKQETRQRLMLTFNSPFFPEVLIASSVMAEGVDLHRFCRHVIHHDLCWNPSTLEQRTGRVDRIGAKVEQCGQSIRLYLPYLAETQDEKMYRVVMDRERWFSVVMGERFQVDARSTEKLAERVPVPESLARELAFRLEAEPPSPDCSP